MGARRAADYNAPGMAGVVFQNTALTRSLADRVVGFLAARLSLGGPVSDILRCAPGPGGDRMHFRHWKRREVVSLLGAAATAWPLMARAQPSNRVRRVGMLMNLSEKDLEAQRRVTAFREVLAQLGWADGSNLRIDYRWAGGDVGRIRAFAKQLVELSPDI